MLREKKWVRFMMETFLKKNNLKTMMFEWEGMVSRGVFHGRNSSTPPEIMR